MTPEQLTVLKAFVMVIDAARSWPVATVVIFSVLAPWLFLWVYTSNQSKRDQEKNKQFDAVVRMYEDNVELVKSYEKNSQNWEKHSASLVDTIYLNTQAMTKLVEKIDYSIKERR